MLTPILSIASISARDVRITSRNLFPDAAVELFFGKAPHGKGDLADIVRVLIEVGRATRNVVGAELATLRNNVVTQLLGYMRRAKGAWQGRLWGIAIVRECYTYVEWEQPNPSSTEYQTVHHPKEWHPLHSASFVKLLNRIRKSCVEDYAVFAAPEVHEAPQEAYFHRSAGLPALLQKRIDGWRLHVPRQFSMYGPILAYLGYIFPLNAYLVKPQRWLSKDEDGM